MLFSSPVSSSLLTCRLYEDAGTCDKYIGYASISPDLCLPVNKGLASVAVKCTNSGGGETLLRSILLFLG